MSARRVLVVEDDAAIRRGVVDALRFHGFEVAEAADGTEGLSRALGPDYDGYDRTIDAHVKNLRQKIESDPRAPRYVQTVHGLGYRFARE